MKLHVIAHNDTVINAPCYYDYPACGIVNAPTVLDGKQAGDRPAKP